MNNMRIVVFTPILICLVFFALAVFLGEPNSKNKEAQQQVENIEQRVDSLEQRVDSLEVMMHSDTKGLTAEERQSVLWMTRAVLSETADPREMVYVANVIRNRVDMRYRGATSVREVVLDSYQFSAFNPGRSTRWRYINMDAETYRGYVWEEAWSASRFVVTASRDMLPFEDPCINHFYYPNVLPYDPAWATYMEQIELGEVGTNRVLFFREDRSPLCR